MQFPTPANDVVRPEELTARLLVLRMIHFARVALIEGGALFAAVVTFLTNNSLPFCLLVLGAAAMAFYRPSQSEFDRLRGVGEQREWQS